jgi:sRNA-binding carbon storage regulator CsrA
MQKGLTLTRKPFEELILQFEDSSGEIIEVIQTITKITGNQVRFSTSAPNNVKIIRGELLAV